MATYEEVKADAEGTDGSEAIGPCVTEVMAEEQRLESEALASLDRVEEWQLIEAYREVT
jgi:hypothetical protein